MRLRTEHQLLQCQESAGTLSKVPEQMLRGHIQPNNRHKLVYCGIEKAGSTFWAVNYFMLSILVIRYWL
jgi:hypothetical protein